MSYKVKLNQIKAFVFDVDGVFTDGSIYLMPDGSMCRVVNVLDGYAVVKALKNGYKIGVITGGNDPMVKQRLEYLGITDYYPKSANKIVEFEDFKTKYQLKNEEILMMGDDLPDIPIFLDTEVATCPPNAVPVVKAVCYYISTTEGGRGAVRDVIEQVMKAQNNWLDDDTKSV
ncbi:MAG: HAD hydrolase family protein [Bergeyella zoohelcum]|nr:HAD hydrolase family protein [Bergeyella zoohelcum]